MRFGPEGQARRPASAATAPAASSSWAPRFICGVGLLGALRRATSLAARCSSFKGLGARAVLHFPCGDLACRCWQRVEQDGVSCVDAIREGQACQPLSRCCGARICVRRGLPLQVCKHLLHAEWCSRTRPLVAVSLKIFPFVAQQKQAGQVLICGKILAACKSTACSCCSRKVGLRKSDFSEANGGAFQISDKVDGVSLAVDRKASLPASSELRATCQTHVARRYQADQAARPLQGGCSQLISPESECELKIPDMLKACACTCLFSRV